MLLCGTNHDKLLLMLMRAMIIGTSVDDRRAPDVESSAFECLTKVNYDI